MAESANRVGEAYVEITGRLDKLDKALADAQRKTDTSIKATGRSIETGMTQAFGRVQAGADRLTATYQRLQAAALLVVGAGLIRNAIQMGDAWNQAGSRINLAVKALEGAANAQQEVFEVAQRSGASLSSVVDMVTRMGPAAQQSGKSFAELLRMVETLGKLQSVSGANNAGGEAALFQLSQALGSGALRGDEFNSVAEQLPALLNLVAEATGKTRGELRKLAEEGKLTSDLLFNVLARGASQVDEQFTEMGASTARAATMLQNSWERAAGQFIVSTGIVETLAAAIGSLADEIASPERQAQLAAWGESFKSAISYLVENRETVLTVLAAMGGAIAGKTFGTFGAIGGALIAGGSAAYGQMETEAEANRKKPTEQLRSEHADLNRFLYERQAGGSSANLLEDTRKKLDTLEQEITYRAEAPERERLAALADLQAEIERERGGAAQPAGPAPLVAIPAGPPKKPKRVAKTPAQTGAEQNARTLADLTDDLNAPTDERDRAVYEATNRLNNFATPAQIQQAGEMAAKIYDQKRAVDELKDAVAAEIDLQAEGQSVRDDIATADQTAATERLRLQRLYAQGVISEQEMIVATAEVERQLRDEQRSEMQERIQELREYGDAWDGVRAALMQFQLDNANASSVTFELTEQGLEGLERGLAGLGSMLFEAGASWDTLRVAAMDALGAIAEELMRVAIRMMIIKPLIGMAGGYLGGSAGITGGSGTDTFALSDTGGGGIDATVLPSAKGNVFTWGDVVPFAKGAVIDKTAIFPMRRGGVGMMAEAGAEAIMPLQRDASGRLGVTASGGDGGGRHGETKVEVNIFNESSSAKVQEKRSRGADGREVITAMIVDAFVGDVANNGPMSRSIAQKHEAPRSRERF